MKNQVLEPVRNRLLAALPRRDLKRLLSRLEPVSLNLGDILYEPGGRIRHCYFPNEGVVSLMIGVRRIGVTNAAGSLARRKLISYSRGNVRILNSKGLQAASCECYETVKAMY